MLFLRSGDDLNLTIITLANGLVKGKKVSVSEYNPGVTGYSLSPPRRSSSSSLLDGEGEEDEEPSTVVKIYNLAYTMSQTQLEKEVRKAGLKALKVKLDSNKKTGAPAGTATLR